jgi:hypothetical protein
MSQEMIPEPRSDFHLPTPSQRHSARKAFHPLQRITNLAEYLTTAELAYAHNVLSKRQTRTNANNMRQRSLLASK